MLTGDGGDEVFGGYRTYPRYARYARWPSWPSRDGARQLRAAPAVPAPSPGDARVDAARNGVQQRAGPVGASSWAGCRRPRSARMRASSGSLATTTTGGTIGEFWREDLPLRTRLQYVDFHTFMPGLVLTKVDRTSMAVSLEARVPLLARRVIEFSFGARRGSALPRRRAERLAAARVSRHPARPHSRPPQEGVRHPALLLEGRQRRPLHSGARAAQLVSRESTIGHVKANGKKALITGITGQDGAYLAEFLLEKGYEVHGIKRRASSFNTDRIDHLYQDPHEPDRRMILHYGDLTDATNLIRIVQQVQPDEIYNLAAQSHVAVSFETPEYTANADALGTLRLLEAIRILRPGGADALLPGVDLGAVRQGAGDAAARDHAVLSALAVRVAKLYAYWITVNYREAYGLFACNGILFNHESPLRGETFVTRKITRGLARIKAGPAGLPVPRQPRRAARLGPRARLRRGAVADAAAAEARGLRHRHRRAALRARRSSTRAAAELGMQLDWSGAGARRARRRRRHGPHRRARRSALLPAGRGRDAARRRDQGAPAARLDAASHASTSWCARWSSPTGAWRSATRSSSAKASRLQAPRMNKDATRFSSPAHRGLVGSAICRALRGARLSTTCWRRARSELDLRDRAAVRPVLRGRAAGVRVPGRGQGRRHPRQRHLPRRLHPRQPRDPDERHRRRVPRRRRASCCSSARAASTRASRRSRCTRRRC